MEYLKLFQSNCPRSAERYSARFVCLDCVAQPSSLESIYFMGARRNKNLNAVQFLLNLSEALFHKR